jgi:4-hydroxy-4-methyl-2-oxoglutarate aldolase
MDGLSEFLQRFKGVSLCQLADALGNSCELENGIEPIDPQFRICGPALTVSCASDDNLTVHHALQMAKPGEVLIVSSGGNCRAALWGELMSISAQAKGLGGTIIDGAARDPLEIKSLGYPVFSRSITARRATKEKYGRIGTAITCGKLQVNPGDIIFADINGILAVPPNQLEEALRQALKIVEKESEIKVQVREGRTIFEVLGLEGSVPPGSPNTSRNSGS